MSGADSGWLLASGGVSVLEPAAGQDAGFVISPGQPCGPGTPVAGLRSVKQDWVDGWSSSEPHRVGPPAIGPDVGESSAEAVLVAELHTLWLSSRPAWVDPSWYDAHIRPQVRALLLLSPGPELLTAVSRVEPGPCPADHAGEGFPLFPTIGSEPGFACDCQLVVAAAWQACESWVQARATRHLVDVMGEDPVVVPADGLAPGIVDPGREEAALVLRYNPRSLASRVDTARSIEAHRDLVDLAETGACSFWTVRLLASDLAELTEEQTQQVTEELTDKITARIRAGVLPWNGSQIRAAAKRLISRVCPKDHAAARARAWRGRRVQVWPRDHGMSVLAATISDADAHRILRRLTEQASGLGDPDRTRDQKRADILTDTLLTNPNLQPPDTNATTPASTTCPASCSTSSPYPSSAVDITGDAAGHDAAGHGGGGDRDTNPVIPEAAATIGAGTCANAAAGSPSESASGSADVATGSGAGAGAGVGAEINVVVKLETLLGLTDDAAEIPGFGPIRADTARELAADGKWRAWITNSAGTVTATSSRTYRPSAALARLVRAREPYCRMPGCRVPASRCDLDHATAWPAGETTLENLGPLCRRHHVLKTHYGWRLEPNPPPPAGPGAIPQAGAPPQPGTTQRPGQTPRPGPSAEPGTSESETPDPGSSSEPPNTDPWREGCPEPDPWNRPPGWSWETPNGRTIDEVPPPPF